MATGRKLKTPAQVRAEFARNGVAVTSWARANNVQGRVVFDVLSGKCKGQRGEGHKVAVLLGLKSGQVLEEATA
ncbi:MAG: DNA-binding protein [Burkholderiaceae bacterium]